MVTDRVAEQAQSFCVQLALAGDLMEQHVAEREVAERQRDERQVGGCPPQGSPRNAPLDDRIERDERRDHRDRVLLAEERAEKERQRGEIAA